MPRSETGETLSAVLAVVVLLVAFGLTWRQRSERARRPPDVSESDRRYHRRQDRRRFRGAVVLALIGLGIGVGGRINVRAGKDDRLAFLLIWGAVFLLLLQLLATAFLDLWSTRRYAERKRRDLASERRRTLEAEIERRRTDRSEDSSRKDRKPPPDEPSNS